jgi:hypothetical protein
MTGDQAQLSAKLLLWRASRFFYLLWGGIILGLASLGQTRFPVWIWDWPRLASKLTSPVGRGMLVGLGLAMALAALREIWELVDMLIFKLLHSGD